jgi:hypothetical protein
MYGTLSYQMLEAAGDAHKEVRATFRSPFAAKLHHTAHPT